MISKDEELQNKIEQSGAAEGIDAYAYKKVFDALKQEPSFHLPANFADQIIAKIEAKRESSRDITWFSLGILLFVIAAIVAVVLTDFTPGFGAFKFIPGYRGLIIFAVGFILALQWLDRKFINVRHL